MKRSNRARDNAKRWPCETSKRFTGVQFTANCWDSIVRLAETRRKVKANDWANDSAMVSLYKHYRFGVGGPAPCHGSRVDLRVRQVALAGRMPALPAVTIPTMGAQPIPWALLVRPQAPVHVAFVGHRLVDEGKQARVVVLQGLTRGNRVGGVVGRGVLAELRRSRPARPGSSTQRGRGRPRRLSICPRSSPCRTVP